MPTLSIITITKNEERHLARALRSVQELANEIIVVDSESTDRTVAVARQFTDTVFVHPWTGYGPQKNFARARATGDWILHIDADEAVSPELQGEIRAAIATATVDFCFLRIVTEFLGRPLRHMTGLNLRLFRRAAGQWDDKEVHEQVERVGTHTTVRAGDRDAVILRSPLLHHSHYQTLAAYLERQERYSEADAQEMRLSGRDRYGRPVSVNPRNPFSLLRFLGERAVEQFFRKFFWQKGFLDGWQGWLWCCVSAQYEIKMCRKYLALLRREREARS